MADLGTFTLGQTELGDSAVAAAGRTTASGTGTTGAPDTTTTSQAVTQTSSPAPVTAPATTSVTAVVVATSVQGSPIQGNGGTESTGGTITALTASPLGATPTTAATADGDIQTLVTGTVLAASGETAAAAGETLTLTLAPKNSTATTSVTTDPVIPSGAGELGTFELGDGSLGTDIRPLLQSIDATPITATVDSDVLATVPALTTVSFSPLLAPSVSEVIDGSITSFQTTTTPATVTAEAIAGTIQTLNVSTRQAAVDAVTTAAAVITQATGTPLAAQRFLSDWAISPGPTVIEDTQEEVRTQDSLTITWRVTEETLVTSLRPQLQQSGKVDVVDRIDGGFDSVARAGTANQVELIPRTGRDDIRPVNTYFVDDYEETPRGTGAGEWEVEVTFVPIKEKAHDNEYGTFNSPPSEGDDPDLWLFEFDFGDVLSRRVTAEVERSPNNTITGATLNIVVLETEARVIEENAGKIGATFLREVPDGVDLLEDVSTGDRNTVTISPPDDGTNTLTPGDYVIEGFETTWNQAAYVLELDVSAV